MNKNIMVVYFLVLIFAACKNEGVCPTVSSKSTEVEATQPNSITHYYLTLNTGSKLEVSAKEYDSWAQGATYYPLCPE